jgi:hypothetical protein
MRPHFLELDRERRERESGGVGWASGGAYALLLVRLVAGADSLLHQWWHDSALDPVSGASARSGTRSMFPHRSPREECDGWLLQWWPARVTGGAVQEFGGTTTSWRRCFVFFPVATATRRHDARFGCGRTGSGHGGPKSKELEHGELQAVPLTNNMLNMPRHLPLRIRIWTFEIRFIFIRLFDSKWGA